ncbi:hypothetical protein Q4491_13105 [Photobacterium sp. 2_MG-2023]|uniref:hypothetical protein n=1 Tax=Photobacterium sp. 2_MG-2023 TaxID=3062663 RepID=UPI0026E2C0CC|nr:hypothetical protein [Photobacterium sp. 2_MG-2023]MDO6582280.1 hypothetical protein [Photobacterium sp. 2_MG-2023]
MIRVALQWEVEIQLFNQKKPWLWGNWQKKTQLQPESFSPHLKKDIGLESSPTPSKDYQKYL